MDHDISIFYIITQPLYTLLFYFKILFIFIFITWIILYC